MDEVALSQFAFLRAKYQSLLDAEAFAQAVGSFTQALNNVQQLLQEPWMSPTKRQILVGMLLADGHVSQQEADFLYAPLRLVSS